MRSAVRGGLRLRPRHPQQRQGWSCELTATCSIDDIEREVIRQVVAAQGLFTENGYLTEEIVTSTLVTGCVTQAADLSECTSDRIEEVADDDRHSYEMVDAVVTTPRMVRTSALDVHIHAVRVTGHRKVLRASSASTLPRTKEPGTIMEVIRMSDRARQPCV